MANITQAEVAQIAAALTQAAATLDAGANASGKTAQRDPIGHVQATYKEMLLFVRKQHDAVFNYG